MHISQIWCIATAVDEQLLNTPQFRNFLTENLLLIIKFKVKYFHGYMTTSKYSYLEYIASNKKSCSLSMLPCSSARTLLKVILATSQLLSMAIHCTLLTQPFLQCEVQSGYFKCACSFIDQRLLAPSQGIKTWQCQTTSCSVKQLVGMHCYQQIWITIIREQVLKYISVQYHRLTQRKEIRFIN